MLIFIDVGGLAITNSNAKVNHMTKGEDTFNEKFDLWKKSEFLHDISWIPIIISKSNA